MTEEEDVDAYRERLRREQDAARGAADSGVAAGVQLFAGAAGLLANVAASSALVGVVVAGSVRLGLELLKNGVPQHYLHRSLAFLRDLEEQNGGLPSNQAAVVESFRHAMGALDDAVFPSLARLVGEYGDGKKPDSFFRGVGEVLAALDQSGLESTASLLRSLIDGISQIPEPTEADEFLCFEPQVSVARAPFLEMGWGTPHKSEYQTVSVALPKHAERWPEVCRRLENAEVICGPVGTIRVPRFWTRPATLTRLVRIVAS